MNNKEKHLSEEEKERLLKEVLVGVFNHVSKKQYKQTFKQVKNEFVKDTLNILININDYYPNIKLTDIVYDDMTLNREKIKKIMLNGASSWNEWSFGGRGIVYTSDLQEVFNKPNWDGERLLELQSICYLETYFTICNLICRSLEKRGFPTNE